MLHWNLFLDFDWAIVSQEFERHSIVVLAVYLCYIVVSPKGKPVPKTFAASYRISSMIALYFAPSIFPLTLAASLSLVKKSMMLPSPHFTVGMVCLWFVPGVSFPPHIAFCIETKKVQLLSYLTWTAFTLFVRKLVLFWLAFKMTFCGVCEMFKVWLFFK